MLEQLMRGFRKKQEEVKPKQDEQLKARLKAVLYEDEAVEELFPVIQKLATVEGFDKLLELVEAKEHQINAIAGGEWFTPEATEQETENETPVHAEDKTVDSGMTAAEEILAKRFAQQP